MDACQTHRPHTIDGKTVSDIVQGVFTYFLYIHGFVIETQNTTNLIYIHTQTLIYALLRLNSHCI